MTTEKREVQDPTKLGPGPEKSKRFDRNPQKGNTEKKAVYQDKVRKIAKDKNKAKAREAMEKFFESIKGKIPAGLKKFANDAINDAIMGVKPETPLKKKLEGLLPYVGSKGNKPGGIQKSKPTKRLNVDDLDKNAPGGIFSRQNKDGRSLYNKGGRVKKQVKKKAGRLALRGYGISR